MRNLSLTIGVLLITILARGQSDIIFPTAGHKTIRNCSITEVRNGNIVYYIKNFNSDSIEALAITKDGSYIKLNIGKISSNNNTQSGLYKGHDYDYYGRLQSNALTKRNIGIGLTVAGLSSVIAGSVGLANSPQNKSASLLLVCGAIISDVGIVLWISGGIKASNNKKAMEMTKRNTNISFGTTNNGVGLVLNF